jgi:FdhD protein
VTKMSGGTSRLEVERISGDRVERLQDVVIKERPATVIFNDIELATLMCTPKDLDRLAVGFLFAEGLVTGKKEIKKVVVDDADGVVWVYTKNAQKPPADSVARRFITTGCGKGLTFVDASQRGGDLRLRSDASIPVSAIHALMKEFLSRSRLHKITGGAHSAALCNSKEILVFNEDIGRHSAIDKVVGECILKGMRMKDRFLVTSGRISSEILIKAARSRVPVIISKSAPTDLAVRLAGDFGITLVGFARGQRMNVYSNGRRILTKARITRKTQG